MFHDAIPDSVGLYRILRPLDESRRVLLAERSTDFEQKVVIKFCTRGGAGAGLEGSILGRLQHENIVQLLGTGVSELGDYLVLEYVDGQPIDVFCRENHLALQPRLELLSQSMAAVAYAHRRLIIHADLKPANVLVTRDENGRPRAKVLDFGNARTLEDASHGQPFYTPLYASPEQKAGQPATIASDIYSLGLLCATLLDQWLRGDLQAVIRKALSISPDDRYASVQAFRDDIDRVKSGLPTSVRRVSAPELALRWSRKRPLLATLVALLLCVIAFSAASVIEHHRRALAERRLADLQLQEAIQLTGVLEGDMYSATTSLTGSEIARQQLRAAASQTLNSLAPIATKLPLRIEVAKQFGNLAKLELSDPNNVDGRIRAKREIQKGLAMVGDGNDPEAEATRRTLKSIQSELR